jgi:tripartite-type tricarboxylate transporter receptor subunit TctC
VRVVVPYPPGGGTDILARPIMAKVSERIGQQFLIDNRGGATGMLGTEIVAKAPPDGYTVLAMANTFATAPSVVGSAGYDPIKDFVGVSVTAWIPQILVVNMALPVKSVKDLIALAKARPGDVTYGSAGAGSTLHVAGELFARQAGVKMLHIPYKGNAPALVDLIGGQISFMLDQISTSIPYITAGKLRPIAVTTVKRSPIYPDLPTISEAGLPGYEAVTYNGIIAPAATPREALTRLHAEIAKAVQTPELRNRYLQQGIELTASPSPDEFTEFLRKDVARMGKLARDAGIKAD